MLEQKQIGTTLITTAEFKDELGKKISPATVYIKYKKPDNSITETACTADAAGNYSNSVLLNQVGEWKFRWESQTGNTVAEEFQIIVLDTKVK